MSFTTLQFFFSVNEKRDKWETIRLSLSIILMSCNIHGKQKDIFNGQIITILKTIMQTMQNLFSVVIILTFENVQMKWEYVWIENYFSWKTLMKVSMRKILRLISDIPVKQGQEGNLFRNVNKSMFVSQNNLSLDLTLY